MSGAPLHVHHTGSYRGDGDDPAYQAFWLLRLGFTVLPVVFGLDKFADVLVDWDRYLAPQLADLLPVTPSTAMHVVGVVEVVAGLVVLVAPRFGGLLVAAWLAGIVLDLALLGGVWDVALRDVGLLLGALTLSRLATAFWSPTGGQPRRSAGAAPLVQPSR